MNKTRLDNIKSKFEELTREIADPAVIADTKTWAKMCREHSALEPIVEKYAEYLQSEKNLADDVDMLNSDDAELAELARSEMEENRRRMEETERELKILLLPKDPDDDKNVIIEIRGGAGGEEAALFAMEVMRMYKMYAEKHGWRVEDIDINATELGGLKEGSINISGDGVFARLKYESGVHRVQRVPDTESQGRIHTSTVTVAVLPEAEDVVVDINDKDLKIDTYRSSGAGGLSLIHI